MGRITNLTSPRYIHFISDEKAYVTQIWDNRIFIVNPKRYEITGYIECPDMTAESGSTEQMVQYGKYVFVNCWSYQVRRFCIIGRSAGWRHPKPVCRLRTRLFAGGVEPDGTRRACCGP